MAPERFSKQRGDGGLLTELIRIPKGVPNWLLFATFVVPAASFLIGWMWGIGADTENTRFVLSTLAGAQASVLAIVFSVTVIGIQLVASRYSPRMISLFTNSPILSYTFLLFVVSIGLDIGLLYNTPETDATLYTAGVYTAIGFGLLTAVGLLTFIRTAIRQSTPEGIIDAFVDELTSDKYLHSVELAVESEVNIVHPLQPLYTMIMEAMSNRRRATAEIALRSYGRLASTTLETFIDRRTFEQIDRRAANNLFQPVLEEHLRDIALHAEEQDEAKLVGEATEWIYELGKCGFSLEDNIVSRQAVMGLEGTILRASIDSGQYIANDSAWRAIGNLLTDAAEHPRPEAVWSTASTIIHRTPQMLWRAHDANRFRHSMTDLYGKMRLAHDQLLDLYEEEMSTVEMDWQEGHVPDETPNRERIAAIDRLRRAFFRSTESFLTYIEEEGDYPITEGNFKDAWKGICIRASISPADTYAVSLCQALIEIWFIIEDIRPEDDFWWMDSLARVKYEGVPEVVDNAFDNILDYEPLNEEPGLWIGVEVNDRRSKRYRNHISVEGFHPLNAHPGFTSRIETLRSRVDKRWIELEEL